MQVRRGANTHVGVRVAPDGILWRQLERRVRVRARVANALARVHAGGRRLFARRRPVHPSYSRRLENGAQAFLVGSTGSLGGPLPKLLIASLRSLGAVSEGTSTGRRARKGKCASRPCKVHGCGRLAIRRRGQPASPWRMDVCRPRDSSERRVCAASIVHDAVCRVLLC